MDIKANQGSSQSAFDSDAIFEQIKERVSNDPAKAKSINAIFSYKITKNNQITKEWSKQKMTQSVNYLVPTTNLFTVLDLKNASVYEGVPQTGVNVDTTITVADSDMVEIALGKLNSQAAFMKGKIKITGNVLLAQKLAPLLKSEAKI